MTHANLFYLLSSTYPGSDHSIPPMGLSSNLYGGHIFWDAEVWMLPALIVQHPDYARSIIDYRFKLLGQAKKNAQAHGFAGAEYPWESADTGAEMAPAEFAKERHITADVGWAAWQYYLWTGDKAYLQERRLAGLAGDGAVLGVARHQGRGRQVPHQGRPVAGRDGGRGGRRRLDQRRRAGESAGGDAGGPDAWGSRRTRAGRRSPTGCTSAFDKARGIPAENAEADDGPVRRQAGRHAAARPPAERPVRRRRRRARCWTSTRPTRSRTARR